MTGPPRAGQSGVPRAAGSRGPTLPRRVAFDLLRAVAERDAYANLTLPGCCATAASTRATRPSPPSSAYGTLRGRGSYDAVLAACVDRPLDQVDRAGARPAAPRRPPAARDAGPVARRGRRHRRARPRGRGGGPRLASSTRCCAGSAARTWPAGWPRSRRRYDADPVGHLAVVHSHPRWVVSALRDALGGSLAETAAMLAADNAPPLVTLVARPGRADGGRAGEPPAPGPGRWSPYAAVLPGGDPGAHPGRPGGPGRGAGRGQPAGRRSRWPTHRSTGADERWLDLCAGPGGQGRAARPRWPSGRGRCPAGGRDRAAPRGAGAARGRRATAASSSRTAGSRPGGRASFDRVLVDAPCTGLGALRRRPEARWRRQPADVAGLAALQRDLLSSALDAVRPGGLVAYVTCSPHLAETRTRRRRRAAPPPAPATSTRSTPGRYCPACPTSVHGPDVQLWPHRHGTDAMYLALLRRG